MATHSQNVLDETRNDEDRQPDVTTEFGEHHGEYGSAFLRECLEQIYIENREVKQPDVTNLLQIVCRSSTCTLQAYLHLLNRSIWRMKRCENLRELLYICCSMF